MSSSTEALAHQMLDLLVDGPSSFAALYGALLRCGQSNTDPGVAAVFAELEEMERRGWVRVVRLAPGGSAVVPTTQERRDALVAYINWLSRATRSELAVDEVGLWFELTETGRAEWTQWTGDVESVVSRAAWTVDDDADSQTITVFAPTPELADEALRWWLAQNPSVALVSATKVLEPVSSFRLRSGVEIANGLRLRSTYRRLE